MKITCPKCGSNDICAQKPDGQLYCRTCRHSFPRIQVFFSYKHGSYTPLVERIKASLEREGFAVWFDMDRLVPGTPSWRAAICKGIRNSEMVFAFLSRAYIYDSEVCRDELSIAVCTKRNVVRTILLENAKEVGPIPVAVSDTQWNDLSDWVRYEMGKGDGPVDPEQEAYWQKVYEQRIGELVDQLCSPEVQRFSGEITILKERLMPYLSEAKLRHSVDDFCGREWLYAQCEDWRKRQNSRAMVLYGPPGIGKSVFSAHYVHMNPHVASAFFCEWNKQSLCTASSIVRTLAYHLAMVIPDFRQGLVDTCEDNSKVIDLAASDSGSVSALFSVLISDTLAKCIVSDRKERYVILIDALNELPAAELKKLSRALYDNLDTLPWWLCFLFTSQSTEEVTREFRYLDHTDIHASSEANMTDIRQYVEQTLRPDVCAGERRQALIAQLCRRSEGIFLYARMMVEAINSGVFPLPEDDASFDALPDNLNYAIRGYAARVFPDEAEYERDYQDLLSVLCASREPVPIRHLREILSIRRGGMRDRIARLSPFVVEEELDGEPTVTLTYQSYYLWFRDRRAAGVYACYEEDGDEMLADLFMAYCDREDLEDMSLYLMKNFLPILERDGRASHRNLKRVIQDESLLQFVAKRMFDRGYVLESNQMLLQAIGLAERCRCANAVEIVASLRMRLALNYINQGQTGLAREALRTSEQRDLPRLAGRHDIRVSVLANLAWVAKEENDLEAADAWMAKALAELDKLKDSDVEKHSKADALYIRGTLLYKKFVRALREPERARQLMDACDDCLNRAIEIWVSMNNDDAQLHISMANMTRAWLMMKVEDYSRAMALFQQTLAVRERIFADNPNSTYIAKSLSNIAECALKIAQTEHSRDSLQYGFECCTRAIRIYEDSNRARLKDYNLGRALCTLAQLYLCQGDEAKALESYAQALDIYADYGSAFAAQAENIRGYMRNIMPG